jgi:hypothetical protein
VLDREYFSVDLGVGLQRVAAIDEQRRHRATRPPRPPSR